ncbi:MAG: glycerol-3-phosphate acyltransferase [Minisyncoccales bacterium]
MALIVIIVISYLLGSIPFPYLIGKLFTGKDIRKSGSGNMGTLNTFRLLKEEKGTKAAIPGLLLVLICDMGKAALALFLAQKLQFLGYDLTTGMILSAAFAVIGHNWPIWLDFKGGRGAACLMGMLLYLDPLSLLVWGVPILIASMITEPILEKRTTFKISQLFSALGTQMVGRAIGIVIGLILLYFYNVQIFYIALIPVILLLIKNIDRVKGYLKELKEKNKSIKN